MLSYVLAGLALGSIYAIAAGSLVITYVASGIFSLAFAAMAFSVARVFYWLNTEQGWPILPSAVVSLLVFAPLLGMALYQLLFRHLRQRSMLVKLMATMGLSVALPPLVELIFGRLQNVTATGLAPRPLKVFHPFNAVVNADQLATYLGLVVVLVVGVIVLRFTEVGLKVRALVDSEALTSLNGTSPGRVSLGVWAVSSTMAGLAGILIAPTAGLSSTGMTYLMSAAFAAVVAAKLRSLPIAVVVALLMGIVTNVIQKYLDAASPITSAIIPSVPFGFMLVALLYYALRGQAGEESTGAALDRAISSQDADPAARPIASSSKRIPFIVSAIFVIVVAILPQIMTDYWAGQIAAGCALAIALVSYTLVTGEGGMVWLCQITFAGAGAVFSAWLCAEKGWSPLVAVIVVAVAIIPVGVILGFLTIRLGNLYVALATLTFGLLVQTLVLTQDPFYNYGSGEAMPRPGFATDNNAFVYLTLVVFLILGLIVLNLRGSTAGLAMSAVRWSENGSRTLGISVVQAKLLISGVATFMAALGGGFLAMNFQQTLPDSFNPFGGLVWLAVLITLGSRSIMAALAAGLATYVMPAVFATYLVPSFGDVPTILFGLGAIALANHPEGVFAQNAASIGRLVARIRGGGGTPEPALAGAGPVSPAVPAASDGASAGTTDAGATGQNGTRNVAAKERA